MISIKGRSLSKGVAAYGARSPSAGPRQDKRAANSAPPERVTPRGLEPRLPDPERRSQGRENRQIDRKWRPDEHRRPVRLTSVVRFGSEKCVQNAGTALVSLHWESASV
jgi:hypothetical protein